MMEKTELTLYLGGTRSGKSARAEAQALRTGGPVLYVATAEARPDDPSMHERIRRHRDRRPPHWSTLECPLHLAKRISLMFPAFFLEAAASVSPEQPPESGVGSSPKDAGEAAQERPTILIDCVTLWVSNILFALPEPEDLTAFETAVRTEVNALLALMERSNCRWILVSGETGLGGASPPTGSAVITATASVLPTSSSQPAPGRSFSSSPDARWYWQNKKWPAPISQQSDGHGNERSAPTFPPQAEPHRVRRQVM